MKGLLTFLMLFGPPAYLAICALRRSLRDQKSVLFSPPDSKTIRAVYPPSDRPYDQEPWGM